MGQMSELRLYIWKQATPITKALMVRFYPSEYYYLPDQMMCRVVGYGKRKSVVAVKTYDGRVLRDIDPDTLKPYLPMPEFKIFS
jgi:hypothetical protein